MRWREDAAREERRLQRRGATRALLAVSLLFAPVPLYVLFVGGLVPFPWVAMYLAPWLIGDPVVMGLAAFHLLADLALLYLVCASVSGLLFALMTPQRAGRATVVVACAVAIASFFPIYVLVGEHDMERATLLGLLLPESR